VAELHEHKNSVNAIAWAPNSATHICTAGDDSTAYIWDLRHTCNDQIKPILSFTADEEINMLQWSDLSPTQIGISFNRMLQVLRV
jgi:WD repeat-containing protein 68